MWSAHDEQWDLAGLRRDTFCNQDSVTFPVIGKTQYITVVRGSESRKIYVQHEEADGGNGKVFLTAVSSTFSIQVFKQS